MKKYIIWNSVVFIFFFGIMSVYLDKIPLVVWMLVVNSNPRIPFVTQDSLFVNEIPGL